MRGVFYDSKNGLFVLCMMLCSSCSAGIPSQNEILKAIYPGSSHKECKSSAHVQSPRWEDIDYGTSALCYDIETIEKEGKYNPFADRKISVWIFYCGENHYFSRPEKSRIKFNIDKRTFIIENSKKPKERSIEPGSYVEEVYLKMKEIF